MRLVMLRHGTREREQDPDVDEHKEKMLPLTSSGELEVRKRALDLKARGIIPNVYLTSCFTHARQTGEILRDTMNNASVDVVELCTLTPHYQGPRRHRGDWRGSRMLEAIAQESLLRSKDLRKLDTVAFILHQPRLAQLLALITSRDESEFSDFRYSEGVCIRTESNEDCFAGHGEVEAHLVSGAC